MFRPVAISVMILPCAVLVGMAADQAASETSPAERLLVLREKQREARSKDVLSTVATDALGLASEAIAAQDQRTATQALNLVSTIARGIGNEHLAAIAAKRQDELRTLGRESAAIRRVIQKVEAGSATAKEVATAGAYEGLVWDDWASAIPLLNRSDDSVLKQIAALEATSPDDPDSRLELAEAWAAMAANESGVLRSRAFDRSHIWFRKVMSQVGPARIEEVRSRMEVLPFRYVTDLDPSSIVAGPWPFGRYGDAGEGHPIKINGQLYALGIGLHPENAGYAAVQYELDRKYKRLLVGVALNDSTIAFAGEEIRFWVIGDGKPVWRASVTQRGVVKAQVIDISGVDVLELRTEAPGNAHGGHAVWLDPILYE